MSILSPKSWVTLYRLKKLATERGVSFTELCDTITAQEIHQLIDRRKPVTLPPGFVPDDDITAESWIDDDDVRAARDAAAGGDYHVAAKLLTQIEGDNARRALAVDALASVAAKDDGWLRDWERDFPSDANAAVVRAESMVKLAWEIRSGAVAKHLSDAQRSGFFVVLDEARDVIARAVALAPHDPTPRVTALRWALGSQLPPEEFAKLWQALIALDPHHRSGHASALQYWSAKWGGSHEQMHAFADHARAASPGLAWLTLYACVEHEGDDDSVWKWPSVTQALQIVDERLANASSNDLASNGLALRSERSMAAYAHLRRKDYVSAAEHFRLLGAHVDVGPWGYSADPRASFLRMRDIALRKAKLVA